MAALFARQPLAVLADRFVAHVPLPVIPTPPAVARAALPLGPPPAVPTTATGADFSIETIGVDAPVEGTTVVEVTPTTTATAAAETAETAETAATKAATDVAAPQETNNAQDSQKDEDEDPEDPETPDEPVYSGECRLMGPFAIFVQLGLGGLALLSLVYKRWRERPQRPVKIWFFDVSKQVFGSVLVHVANVFMSLLTSGRFSVTLDAGTVARTGARAVAMMLRRDDDYTPNPCSFYLLNLGIDTTLGIPILIGLLRLTTWLVSYTPLGQPPASIQSGNYGHPPNAWWWLKQSVLYFCGLFGMKLCVLILFLAVPWISHIGDWALRWTEGNEQLQIVFVMMLFPLMMNAMQYYIIDSFIKEQPDAIEHHHHHHHQGHGHHENDVLYDHLSDSDDDDDEDHQHHHHHHDENADDADDSDSGSASGTGSSSSSEELVSVKHTSASSKARHTPSSSTSRPSAPLAPLSPSAPPEYDPDVDGDSRTILGSSSSSQRGRPGTAGAKTDAAATIGSLDKELFGSK